MSTHHGIMTSLSPLYTEKTVIVYTSNIEITEMPRLYLYFVNKLLIKKCVYPSSIEVTETPRLKHLVYKRKRPDD